MKDFTLRAIKVCSLLFFTVRYLKLKQLVYQVYYRVRKPRLRLLSKPELRGVLEDWLGADFIEPATDDGVKFCFLGQVARLESNWNASAFPKLWLYNLHYQDYLNAIGARLHPELGVQMVDAWITGNPPMSGNGWEPYCLSLRIVNWVKFFSRLGAAQVNSKWLESLAQQADALEQQLEFHILANHLFANGKALVFVGSYLGGDQGDKWLKMGLDLLDREIPEQFLSDGAHFERSPMYQGILLWDIADLIMLSQQTRLPELKQRETDWRKRFSAGSDWLITMLHPDGDISFFNDAAFGVAPDAEYLKHYARLLELPPPEPAAPDNVQSRFLEESGYAAVNWPEKHCLLVDLAPIGPDYQPGHAHADTLSCELSLFGHRVLVNSGISLYGDGVERHRQRSTAAHNTVVVDGENSSEVWSGFRVARRANPCDVSLKKGAHGVVVIEGTHDGYCRLSGKVKHHRRWFASDSNLIIEDFLYGDYGGAAAHWHFHPDVKINQVEDDLFVLILPNEKEVFLNLEGNSVKLLDGTWHPCFGASVPNRKLIISPQNSKMALRIEWRRV